MNGDPNFSGKTLQLGLNLRAWNVNNAPGQQCSLSHSISTIENMYIKNGKPPTSAFGVPSVWINIVRRPTDAAAAPEIDIRGTLVLDFQAGNVTEL